MYMPGSSFFLGKVTALGVLCCFALFVCLTLLASFFLPSHLSFKNMYANIVLLHFFFTHTCLHIYNVCTCIYTQVPLILSNSTSAWNTSGRLVLSNMSTNYNVTVSGPDRRVWPRNKRRESCNWEGKWIYRLWDIFFTKEFQATIFPGLKYIVYTWKFTFLTHHTENKRDRKKKTEINTK